MSLMSPRERSDRVKNLALELGFDGCGIARAQPMPRGDYVQHWLSAGRAGSMRYLHEHLSERLDPTILLPDARSIIMLARLYHQPEPVLASDGSASQRGGRIAMYAWGEDYHRVIREKVHLLVEQLQKQLGEPFDYRVCVDTAPIVERQWAEMAGIGWIGKNTLVLSERLGSYFFLAALVTTIELEADEPVEDHCGSCTACLDACPTKAFPAPYEMDASRCISFLTIEHRGEIPANLRESVGDWLFGCDVCQQVCPFNRKAPVTTEARFTPRTAVILDPDPVLNWSRGDYRRNLGGTAMTRATLAMWWRNAAIVAENLTKADQRAHGSAS